MTQAFTDRIDWNSVSVKNTGESLADLMSPLNVLTCSLGIVFKYVGYLSGIVSDAVGRKDIFIPSCMLFDAIQKPDCLWYYRNKSVVIRLRVIHDLILPGSLVTDLLSADMQMGRIDPIFPFQGYKLSDTKAIATACDISGSGRPFT